MVMVGWSPRRPGRINGMSIETAEQTAERPGHPAALLQALAGQKRPPLHLWNPPYCGEIDIRIARDGSWHYRGTPIGRPALVRLFASVLRREPDGRYVLVTPVEMLGITVEDVPFLAVELVVEGAGRNQRLIFRTNVDDAVAAGAEHPIRVEVDPVTAEPAPYVLVRDRLEARIHRPVFYELVERGVQEGGRFGVWSDGVFFALGSLDE